MKFYTYCHTRNDTGAIFYIGKGQGRRAGYIHRKNTHWKNIVNKHGHSVEILAYWGTEKEANDHEILLISSLKDIGIPLVNMTNGGEGISGIPRSLETKQKISTSLTGRKFSDISRKKMSEAAKGKVPHNKGKISSLETKQKMSEARKLYWAKRKEQQCH